MGIIETIRGWLSMLFGNDVQREFDVQPIQYASTESLEQICFRAYQGVPPWVDAEHGIKTVNFAKSVCVEVARLTTMGGTVKLTGSARATWLQEQVDRMMEHLRQWEEYACATGTIILKPNGDFVDIYTPGEYAVVDVSAGRIDGAVFESHEVSGDGKKFYTRLEYHYFDDDGAYHILNHCYVSDSQNGKGKPVDIKATPWAMLEEESTILGLEKPLFSTLKTPHANHVDIGSPLSLPIFVDALKELEDLDVAYSRNAGEIYDSKRLVLLDSNRLIPFQGGREAHTPEGYRQQAGRMNLPDYVNIVQGGGASEAASMYQEINPTLETDVRLSGINALLSEIGFKCGFSNGAFVFNEKSGVVTATQVEADQQRTIQLIADNRHQLQNCLEGLIYALDKFADLYNLAPSGSYKVEYNFDDILYSYEADKQQWWSYVMANKVPAWMYFVKFEGMTEKEAKAMQAEMDAAQPALFEEE